MKRPAFQFYPADWRNDAGLRLCSVSARGLWIDMLCVMHAAEPYGHLCAAGRPLSAADLAKIVGETERNVQKWLDEIVRNNVCSLEDGVIVSRRMVRDEILRTKRAEGGSAGAEHGIKGKEFGVLGGRPSVKEGGKEPPFKPPPSSSSSSSSSASAKDIAPSELPAPPLRVVKPASPPPDFNGQNAQALNGKSVVPISMTWELPEEWGVDAEALGWRQSEVLYESEKFRQYWTVGKGAGTRRAVKSWRQSWSNWLGKAAERKQR
jgi:hypothetical protein